MKLFSSPNSTRSFDKESDEGHHPVEKREAAGVSGSVMRMLRGTPQGSSSSSSVAPQQDVPPQEFIVTLDRSTASSLGLTFDGASTVISSIDSEGLAASWNASNPGKELRVGHRIVQVNGRTDVAGMNECLRSQELLEIRLCREAVPFDSEDRPSTSPCSSPGQNATLKGWVADVASEEAPPTNGMKNLKDKFDANRELTGATKTKDADLVELPSPSIHTSLMTSSLLSPREAMSTPVHQGSSSVQSPTSTVEDGRKPDGKIDSRTAQLSTGDLASLREMAVEAATANGNGVQQVPSSPSNLLAGTRSMWSVSSTGTVPTVPESTPPLVDLDAGTDSAMQAKSRSMAPDEEGRDIAPVHSSLSTSSPSLHQTLRQDHDKQALFSGMAVSSFAKTSNMLEEQLQIHGSGTAHASIGFLGSGPFWTCGTTPQLRQHRCAATSGRTTLGGILRDKSSPAVGAIANPFDLSTKISNLLSSCTSVLSTAIDVADEPEPPDNELTTVLLETKEQRLQWRDFLSEAVSKCRANALFASYDVDADPPRYARPPMSSAPPTADKVDAIVRSYRQVGKTPPHVVAPCGAGFSQPPWAFQGASSSSTSARNSDDVQLCDPSSTSSPSSTIVDNRVRPTPVDLDSGVGLTPNLIESGLSPDISALTGGDLKLASTAKASASNSSQQRPPPAG